MTTATALMAYLERNNIRPLSLAKTCHISKSYLSMLLNGQRPNSRFPILVRLAVALDLPVHRVQELLHTFDDSILSENLPEVLSEKASQNQFLDYLQQILDALEQNDLLTVSRLNDVIHEKVPDSVPLKSHYSSWYEAYNLTFQNNFESAIPLFLKASTFTARYEIEKRFKAKILVGLGAAYTARGQYQYSIRCFRQSLLLWAKGTQAARVYMNLGTLYRRLAKYEFSVCVYEHAYELGTEVLKLYALAGLIQLSLDQMEYNKARKYVLKGYALAKTFNSPRGKGDLYCNIAEYYFAIDKLHRSEVFFRKAIYYANISRNLRTKHWAEIKLAMLILREGLVKEFNALIKMLESELSGTEDVLLVANHLNVLGRKYLDHREYLRVIMIAEEAYKLLISLYRTPFTEFKECCELLYEANTALQEPQLAHFYLNEIKRIK